MVATKDLILIVEDDVSTREFLARALGKTGVETAEAGTAGEALMALEQEPMPSTIILDLMLPDSNGVTVLRRIRRGHLPIRVAVVTGMTDPEAYFDLMKFHPDRIFKKPMNLAEVLDWVQSSK